MNDPILECLLYLARHHNLANSGDALISGLPLADGKLTLSLLPQAADRAGLMVKSSHYSVEDLPIEVLPALVPLKDGSALVVLDSNHEQKQWLVVEPDGHALPCWQDWQDLNSQITEQIYLFKPKFVTDKRSDELVDTKAHWFWSTLKLSSSLYRDVILASLLINLFALAIPLFTRVVYDKVVPNLAFESLWVLASGAGLVVLFDLVIKMLRSHFIDLAGKRSDLLLSSKIFSKVLGIKMSSRPASVGAFAKHMQDFESIRDFLTSATITLLIDVPFALLFLGVIALMAGNLVWIPIVVVTVLLVQSLLIQKRLKQSIEQGAQLSSQKHATLIESLSGLETLKRFGAQGQMQYRWEQAVSHMAHWSVKTKRLTDWVQSSAGSAQQVASISMIILGVYLIAAGELTMGGLIAASMISGKAISPLLQLAMLSTRYNQAKSAYTMLENLMAMPEEQSSDKQYLHRPALAASIDFANVSFQYPESQTRALTSVSFAIKPGEKVAILGRIGSGKTTLERLLLGLYQPSEGSIRIGGTDIGQLHPDDVRRNIGSVPQDPGLFYGSIRDNIILGRPQSSERAILQAANRAGVTEFSNPDPAGLDRQVGEGGQQLSGGQRQSIAIARALLTDPPILLMDEPTSAMDNRSEMQIKQQLQSLPAHQTLVLITHKISMLDVADRILIVDHGRLVADGPKAQVLKELRGGKLKATVPG
ncbi:type I secretion system permease/ATPase [Ferrimonas aestuarii]|uniref:Type I secretion system permease/ATPase n=1 Tax=Ferrimonas aestuarii TaxID=2569539 RepID=A0A4U1BTT3_9GAMM|nr:type I secretion system permease/ATPase [Ferrimonas aestuarii]TKB57425.1 type I secretion system permease/ATPase [Ferrimonas aestuarii]